MGIIGETYKCAKTIEKKILVFKNKRYFVKKVEKRNSIDNNKIDKNYENGIKKYWDSYIKINLGWHKWYTSINGIRDVRYIPEDIFHNIIFPYYNNKDLAKAYSDKSYCSLFFKDVNRPEVIVKNINGLLFDDNFNQISYDEMMSEILKEEKIMIKSSIDSGDGKNIIFIQSDNPKNMKQKTNKALENLSKNFVIQKFIVQHDVLSELNPTSVNTIRIMSFLNREGVHTFNPYIRIGINNSFFDHYGLVCGITNEGKLKDFLIDDDIGNILLEHPQGYEFKGILIPGLNKIEDIIKKEHLKLGHFRLISWDFAVDKQGEPILIEVNLRRPGISNQQLVSGPLFGDLTDQILEEVLTR